MNAQINGMNNVARPKLVPTYSSENKNPVHPFKFLTQSGSPVLTTAHMSS
jgi:hypothetical protein